VYQHPLADEEITAVLLSCPEVEWLAQCAISSPLPSGWRQVTASIDMLNKMPLYLDEKSGEVSQTPPFLSPYVSLANLAIHATHNPAMISSIMECIRVGREQLKQQAAWLDLGWTGPYTETSSGQTFYHCHSSGQSAWVNPGAPSEFAANVADKLLLSETLLQAVRSSKNNNLVQNVNQAQEAMIPNMVQEEQSPNMQIDSKVWNRNGITDSDVMKLRFSARACAGDAPEQPSVDQICFTSV